MTERLFAVALTANKLAHNPFTGSAKAKTAIDVVVGWDEGKAYARQAGLEIIKRDLPESKGWHHHEATVLEIEPARMYEWASKAGWASPETVERLHAEIEALKKQAEKRERAVPASRRGRREWIGSDDESEVLV